MPKSLSERRISMFDDRNRHARTRRGLRICSWRVLFHFLEFLEQVMTSVSLWFTGESLSKLETQQHCKEHKRVRNQFQVWGKNEKRDFTSQIHHIGLNFISIDRIPFNWLQFSRNLSNSAACWLQLVNKFSTSSYHFQSKFWWSDREKPTSKSWYRFEIRFPI